MVESTLWIGSGAGREAEIGRLVARGFTDSDSQPPATGLGPRRQRQLTVLMQTASARDAARSGHLVAAVERRTGQVVGCAMVVPTTALRRTTARRIRMAPTLLRAAAIARTRFPAYLRSSRQRAALPGPEGESWLWHSIVVDPDRRGQGIAGALMRHGMTLLAGDDRPSHLHTVSPAIRRICTRLGWVEEGPPTKAEPDGPAYTLMVYRPD